MLIETSCAVAMVKRELQTRPFGMVAQKFFVVRKSSHTFSLANTYSELEGAHLSSVEDVTATSAVQNAAGDSALMERVVPRAVAATRHRVTSQGKSRRRAVSLPSAALPSARGSGAALDPTLGRAVPA